MTPKIGKTMEMVRPVFEVPSSQSGCGSSAPTSHSFDAA